jgi:pimeloyl-ACP methyl ester carboxylesterase
MGEAVRAAFSTDLPAWAGANADAFVGAGLDGNHVSPEQADWLLRDLLGVSLPAALGCNRAMLETDFTEELRALDLPVLLVHGDADASIPLELASARTVELVPGARLVVYRNGPHGLFLTHRAQLSEDLLAFAKG